MWPLWYVGWAIYLNRLAHLDHLAEHFMADDQFILTGRRFGAPPGCFFPVGSADAHTQDAQFDLIVRCQGRFRAIHKVQSGSVADVSTCSDLEPL